MNETTLTVADAHTMITMGEPRSTERIADSPQLPPPKWTKNMNWKLKGNINGNDHI